MTSESSMSRLRETVAALRSAKPDSDDILYGYSLGGAVDEDTATAAAADGVPPEFLDFCRVLDGADCNPSVQLFGLEEAEEHQYYCGPLEGSELPLSPETLYCIGMIHETPLYLDRRGGGVLGIPDEHREWFDATHLEHLADGLETFFLEWLAGSRYKQLALIDDEMVEFDDWLKLLRRAGLVGPTVGAPDDER